MNQIKALRPASRRAFSSPKTNTDPLPPHMLELVVYHGKRSEIKSMYYDESREVGSRETVQYVANYDPFVVQTLQSVEGSGVVIQTTRGNVRGTVAEVRPDHVVIETDGTQFFVRIQQIVWIMPE